MKPARLATLLAVAALAPAAISCGDDDDPAATETTESAAAAEADLGAIKRYLTEHSAALAEETAKLKEQGRAYYDLAKTADFDHAKMLEENREEVVGVLEDARRPTCGRTRPTRRWRASWPASPRSPTTT
jgi:hypothetical protein